MTERIIIEMNCLHAHMVFRVDVRASTGAKLCSINDTRARMGHSVNEIAPNFLPPAAPPVPPPPTSPARRGLFGARYIRRLAALADIDTDIDSIVHSICNTTTGHFNEAHSVVTRSNKQSGKRSMLYAELWTKNPCISVGTLFIHSTRRLPHVGESIA